MSPKKSSAAFASKNLKKLAPAFVVTVALLVPQGCGGNVDDGSGPGASGTGGSGGTGGSTAKGGTGGSSGASGTAGKGGGGGTENTIDCPLTQPPFGGPCETGVGRCVYQNGGCGQSTSECVNGKWVGSAVSCNPPPPPCPDGEIVEGESCPGGGFGQTTCPRVVDGCDVTFTCQGTWKKTVGTCATCPKEPPPVGAKCQPNGLSCAYTVDFCPVKVECKVDTWTSTLPGICNPPPPPPSCPSERPAVGDACPGATPQGPCTFFSPDGCSEAFSCAQGKWFLSGKPCDEPAKPACEAALDAGSCSKDPGCRWLVPGCASPPQIALAKAGCFAVADCTSDAACTGGRACTSVVIDPCAGKSCDACGQEMQVCQ